MILIGEKLNSSIPSTQNAILSHDEEYLTSLIKFQEKYGADFLDINTAISADKELDDMLYLVSLCLENSKCGIMIDSPDPDIIIKTVPYIKDREIFINSVTATERIDSLKDIIAQTNSKVVVLPIGNDGFPDTAKKQLENAYKAADILTNAGVKKDNIFFDVLVTAVSSGSSAENSIEFINELKDFRTVCGLSNISYGLPKRINLNTAYLAMMISHGINAAILDLCSPRIRETLYASLAICGKDEFGIEYLTYIRDSEN